MRLISLLELAIFRRTEKGSIFISNKNCYEILFFWLNSTQSSLQKVSKDQPNDT